MYINQEDLPVVFSLCLCLYPAMVTGVTLVLYILLDSQRSVDIRSSFKVQQHSVVNPSGPGCDFVGRLVIAASVSLLLVVHSGCFQILTLTSLGDMPLEIYFFSIFQFVVMSVFLAFPIFQISLGPIVTTPFSISNFINFGSVYQCVWLGLANLDNPFK